MFSLAGAHNQPKGALRVPGAGIVWATVAVVLLVGGIFVWLHYEGERVIHRVGATASAVADAHNQLTSAFLQLALHESHSSDGIRAVALRELGEVEARVDTAIERFDATAGPPDYRGRLVAFRTRISELKNRLPALPSADTDIAVEAARFTREVEGLDADAALMWAESAGRLDRLFLRTVIGLGVLLVLVLVIVMVAAIAARRSRAEHLKAAAESQRQTKLLGAIAEGTTDAVFVKDRTGRYIYANRATAQFVGRPIRDVIGKEDRELFDPASADGLRDHDSRLMAENRTETFEESLSIGGQVRTFLVTKGPLHDDEGQVIGLIGVSCDITSRKRDEQALGESEHALRASEERYRHFLDVLPDAVFVLENDGIAFCNPAFVSLRGASSANDLIGTSVYDMYLPETHRSVRSRLDDMFMRGFSPGPVERRLLRVDGRQVPVLVSATQVLDASKRSVLVVLRDLSRQHHAEAWAQSILSNTKDAIISTDQFGTITSFNPAAERVLGYMADEVIGRNVSMIVPDDLPFGVAGQREIQARRKDGVTVPLEVAVSEFELDGERQLIGVARDVSEHRKLEAELRQAHKMEALGQVAGGVAHDFNNLLTVILGYSDMLQEQFPEGDPRRQFASDIRRASGRAADLTRQLLTFSRRTVVAPKVIDVNNVVKDMNRMLRRVLGEDVELAVGFDAEPRSVYIDPGSLEQIVMNLCVNARDAMPTGGRLTITTGHGWFGDGVDATRAPLTPGEYVTITVTDSGEGIPDAVRDHIFEPFFTTKGAGKGTGLGLAVVQGLVEQNKGHILLETAAGKGTAFTIALPSILESVTVVTETRSHAPRGGGETVLVVEDEEPVRRLAVIALASAGYRVLDAADGRQAIELFDHHRAQVDVVLTDVVMPNIGGRELAEALRERQPSLRVIFTSGYADDAVLRHGITKAEVPFLPKPYTPTTLLSKVREVIDLPPVTLLPPPPA